MLACLLNDVTSAKWCCECTFNDCTKNTYLKSEKMTFVTYITLKYIVLNLQFSARCVKRVPIVRMNITS